MKNSWICFLFAITGFFFIASCKNGNKGAMDTGNDPVFQQDPVLKAVTAEINKTPTNAKLFVERGDQLHKLKMDSLAINDYKRAISIDSTNATYYSVIGDILFEHKDVSGSVEWFEKALQKDPTDKKARLKIAKMLMYVGKDDESITQINIVLRKDAYNPEAYFLKGMCFKDKKDTAKAISSFLTAVQVAPEYRDAIIQLGMLYSHKKDSIALRYLDNAFKIDSTDVFPIFARGVFYQESKDFARAKEEYKKCIIKNRHYFDAYFNMGYILMQQDSVPKALRQYDMVTKIDPRNPTAYYDRGVCKEAMDSMKEAVEDYRHALILDPNYNSPKDALKRLKVKEPGEKPKS